MRIGIIRIEVSIRMFAILRVILRIGSTSVTKVCIQMLQLDINSHGTHLASAVAIFSWKPSLVWWIAEQKYDDIVNHSVGYRYPNKHID